MFQKQPYKGLFVVLLVIIAAMFVVMQVSLAGLYSSIEPRTINVNGQATLTAEPDEATMYFGYEVQKATAIEAQQDNADVIDAVRNALVGLGVDREDLATSYFSVEPVNMWDDEKRTYETVGYRAVHILKLETASLGSLGAYADAAARAGANRFDSVSFGLSDQEESSIRNQVIQEAAANAREKAEAMASGLGVRLTYLHSSTESVSYSPYYARAESAAGAEPAPTEITPGLVEVTATLSVSYEFV